MKKNHLVRTLIIGALCIGTMATSCNKIGSSTSKEGAVARVNDVYLDKYEVLDLVPSNADKEDSLAIVNRFIDKWATKNLLIEAAELNLSKDKKEEIEKLVAQFKTDLLIKDYLEKLVQKNIDTIINEKDLKVYYDKYKNNFLVEDMLVKMSYANVLKDNSNYGTIRRYFSSNRSEDHNKLESMSLHMKTYALNDSIWVDVKQIYDKLPFLNSSNKDNYLKNNSFFEVEEENSTYFVKVNKVLSRGSVIPFEYLKTSLKMMVINDRKMELLKQYEEDILKDAKKNKRYEVF
ncbi:hypothetical protein SAMN04488018_11220 [Myroides marinus]|uniref:Peptidylprolyl isomerase n=1 Tax=Myroides marinus TaxID=703342 RepID=A0A1H6W381_9FLAO|nr:hypothetical protein [Myroides marinus]SEJ10296.1 hypothetical protein SAMN04488018_11220 [Myroides marinus]